MGFGKKKNNKQQASASNKLYAKYKLGTTTFGGQPGTVTIAPTPSPGPVSGQLEGAGCFGRQTPLDPTCICTFSKPCKQLNDNSCVAKTDKDGAMCYSTASDCGCTDGTTLCKAKGTLTSAVFKSTDIQSGKDFTTSTCAVTLGGTGDGTDGLTFKGLSGEPSGVVTLTCKTSTDSKYRGSDGWQECTN